MRYVLCLLLLVNALSFAKDKKEEAKPVVDDKTQADIFRSQRDYTNLARQAMPIEIELRHREDAIKAKLAKAQEACGDGSKWRLNPVTLECDAAPPPPPPPHPCAKGEFPDSTGCVASPDAPK